MLESRGSGENRLESGRSAVQELALGRCKANDHGEWQEHVSLRTPLVAFALTEKWFTRTVVADAVIDAVASLDLRSGGLDVAHTEAYVGRSHTAASKIEEDHEARAQECREDTRRTQGV